MKLKLIILLIILFISGGCETIKQLSQPKPVEIDGLGSLSSLKDKQLNREQVKKILESLSRQKRITDDDAESLLNIYKNNSEAFLQISGLASQSDQVRDYLSLILEKENLGEEVKSATSEIILRETTRLADFSDEPMIDGTAAGDLAGVYTMAAVKTIAKSDDDLRRQIIKQQQTEITVLTVAGYELAANEMITGKREATVEQKKNAEKFLADLKAYNETLSPKFEILDANGRLIKPSEMSGDQLSSLEAIFGGKEKPSALELYNRMEKMRDKLRMGTEEKLH